MLWHTRQNCIEPEKSGTLCLHILCVHTVGTELRLLLPATMQQRPGSQEKTKDLRDRHPILRGRHAWCLNVGCLNEGLPGLIANNRQLKAVKDSAHRSAA